MSLSGSSTTTSKEQVRIPRTEEFYCKIYQQVATGIAIADWQGVFQECNPAFCALLGYTEKELQTLDFVSLIHPEDGKPIWFKFTACKSEKFPLLRSKMDTFTRTVSRCGFASSFLFCMAKRGNQHI